MTDTNLNNEFASDDERHFVVIGTTRIGRRNTTNIVTPITEKTNLSQPKGGVTLGHVVGSGMAPNKSWVEHAYPLQQITIQLQGTRHSDRNAIIEQLETVLKRLKCGDESGESHDDDFGYRFTVELASKYPSFFDEPAGNK
ncbi:hypothetical protein [Undibacterium sp.]|uniref:hypothetical protein n=1 Tax=Undibacterium sp. TaxID=1914977 RepID=UPI003753CC2D